MCNRLQQQQQLQLAINATSAPLRIVRNVRNKPQQITRLALERPADFAQVSHRGLEFALRHFIKS
tara:strand:- start:325 stop:519 length:195 start_codon:yes stop_codon:yes gene_type:complete